MTTPLPIDDVLSDLTTALRKRGCGVLQAPPGAGKTTRVPLAMLEAGLTTGGILMLEPRRLAARAAAARMAQTLGQKVGQTVGYRMRGEAQVSAQTRIEVVTEGILTRRLQRDPGLEGVGAVIFDEFHERSLNADLGLALCLEVRAALRDDLIILVMSATLDAGPVADLIGAPVITSMGKSYPVETRWLERAPPKDQWYEPQVAALVRRAIAETTGSILTFLPGEGEIRRTEALLRADLPKDCVLAPLFGAMNIKDQRAAIAAPGEGRKIVLATSIAETSLTIEGITCVVDAGRARRARFDPGSGMSRLVTERVTRAEATQRQGRAGRLAPGVCYRMWTEREEGGLAAFPPPQIEAEDLTGLALDLAEWGAAPEDLSFLSPPPPGPYGRARALLQMLQALDGAGRITEHGRAMAALPLHPRLAHMLIRSGPRAAPLAALLDGPDPMREAGTDLTLRLEAIAGHAAGGDRATLERSRLEARRLQRLMPKGKGVPSDLGPAQMAALAFPDRIGKQRKPGGQSYLLSGGKGAHLGPVRRGSTPAPPGADARQRAPFIVATDLDGDPREARIRQAITITEDELRAVHGDLIARHKRCFWNDQDKRVEAVIQEELGAIVLTREVWTQAPPEDVARALLQGVRNAGLKFSPAAARLCARVELLRKSGAPMPDLGQEALLDRLETWLLPHMIGQKSMSDFRKMDLFAALEACLDWPARQALEEMAPASFTTPPGRKIAIEYDGDVPAISLKLQEMFGVTRHPTVGADHQPLRITLLSPAGRPLQTTMDLPGFWETSYIDVRKDMRGRYPKHPWPEDPATAQPSLRLKPRP